MPTIPPLGNPEVIPIDTTVANRKVLIEEFTGVGCVNCPAGSKEIENLLARYPNNLIAISIHAGFFSKPYTNSVYDFRTDDADDLVGTYFGGEPFAYPSATINRQKTNTGSFYVTLQSWPGLIQEEIDEDVQVSLAMDHTYNEGSREMSLTVTIDPEETISNDLRISVLVTESGVVDYQLLPDPDGWTSDYKHKHILREIITPFDGDIVSGQELIPGAPVERTFTYTLPTDWNAEECTVVALVHKNTPTSKEVLNAEEVHLIE